MRLDCVNVWDVETERPEWSVAAHLTSGAHITVPGVRNMEIIFQENSNGIGGQPPPTLDFLAAAVNSRKRAFPASSVRIVQSNGGNDSNSIRNLKSSRLCFFVLWVLRFG